MSRTVLVTGANRGIGLTIARTMRDAGHTVVAAHRGDPPPDEFAAVHCDVTDATSVESAYRYVEEQVGPVEVLVSNAGITDDTLLLRMREQQFADVLDTNLVGAYRMARRAVRGMLRGRWGRMIFISSVVAVRGAPGQVNYAASKAGLLGVARAISRELGGRGITANLVTPGFIPTDITDRLPEELKRAALADIPAGRYGSREEVAAAVCFLASDAAGYITGAVLPVDGGLGMGH